MQMLPLIGFAPDKPPTTPGVMTECRNIVPNERGFESGPAAIAGSGIASLSAPSIGAAEIRKSDGSRRTFVATANKIWELSGTTWIDQSRVGGYTTTSLDRCTFAQFGNTTLASNRKDVIQASTSGAFADIAGSPKAKIVFSVGDFVMALNTDEGTFGVQGDRWWCSGIFDHTTWTPSVSTQANSGQLVGSGGDLVAGLALGRQAIAYKQRAMWQGAYVGGAAVWQWEQIPGDQGAVGPEAVCDVNGVHVFVGMDNIWTYDGVRARPIGDDTVRQWFYNNSSPAYRSSVIVRYERQNNRVWVFFPNNDPTTVFLPNEALVYHMGRGTWGRYTANVTAAFQFVQPAITIDGLSGVAASMDAMPLITFDSQFWSPSGIGLGVVDNLGQLRSLTGSGPDCSFTTGYVGDSETASYVSKVKVGYNTMPLFSKCTGQVYANVGSAAQTGGIGDFFDGACHVRQSGRWHRFEVYARGPCEFSAIGYDLKAAGRR